MAHEETDFIHKVQVSDNTRWICCLFRRIVVTNFTIKIIIINRRIVVIIVYMKYLLSIKISACNQFMEEKGQYYPSP